MNKTMKFGCSAIGKYTVIKLNIKLDASQIDKLKEQYKDWLSFIDNGKFGCRIEGVLPANSVGQFMLYDIKRAKYITDAINATEKIRLLDGEWIPPVECWTKANLNEI